MYIIELFITILNYLGFEWKGDASMIRSSLPIDNIQLHGPGFIDIKLLWKELETKWNFQLPFQSTYKFFISSTMLYFFLKRYQHTIYFVSLAHIENLLLAEQTMCY